MYGKWLFKEIKTEYGHCKVEIFRKGYTASAVEIGALEGNSLTLALENLSNITDPIGKSVCSFSIIDTDQIEYDDFFTPDATAYMVVVSTKVEGGAYVTRWSGYVTPDFFAENLSYRTPISISARDNIGYLNDVDFDLDAATITVRGLIVAAFNRIAEDYPMQIVFATQKQTSEGVLAIDATISTMLLREGSWYEALETILHDLGLQMRWVDNNTIAVMDLSQIPEYFALQRFNFIGASGYREILPAWREFAQEQDYGLRENFFEGQVKPSNMTFVKTQNINTPISMGGVGGTSAMRYYVPNNWGVAGTTYTINTEDYNYIGTYGQEANGQEERIYFTGVEKSATNLAQNFMSWRQPVYVSQKSKMRISFQAFNSLLATDKSSSDTLKVYNPTDNFMNFSTGDSLQLGLKVNVFLHSGTKSYILGETWQEISGAETNSLYFVLDKIGQLGTNSTAAPAEQEITIDVNTIPYDGELELRIYGFCIHEKTNLQEDGGAATYDWLRMVSYIDKVSYSYQEESATGQNARTEIAQLHNIKQSESYSFGQVPVYAGGINAYVGGLYNASNGMQPLNGFKRNADAQAYNSFLELVGREAIHFNKKNYTKLSGSIKNLSKEPLGFNKLFVYKGKNYAPYACSLNVISNEMNITTMQEVEPYMTQSFVEIKSELVTGGGATISGGNNTALQYSAEVGNAKRISELNNASESEKKESYIVIDNATWNESKKVPLSEMEGLDEAQVEAYLTEKKYAKQSWVESITNPIANNVASIAGRVDVAEATIKTHTDSIAKNVADIAANATAINTNATNITKVSNRVTKLEGFWDVDADGNLHTTYNIVVEGGGAFGKGSTSGGGGTSGGLGSVTIKTEGGVEYKSNASGVVAVPNWITASALNGYATQSWVGNNYQPKGNYLTSVSWSEVSGKPSFATVATSGKYSDLSGLPTIPTNNNQLTNGAGYITGITSAMVTTALGSTPYNSTNPSGYITSAALNGYATQSWVGANYLPLSGGTMSGVITMPVNYQIQWGDSSRMIYGSTDTIKVYAPSGLFINDNLVIHSGNIGSQSVDKANVLKGIYPAVSSTNDLYNTELLIKYHAGFSPDFGNVPPSNSWQNGLLEIGLHSGGATAQFYFSRYKALYYRSSTDEDWNRVAYTSDNVASATKLQTARTIWGQSFDGTADISGILLLNNGVAIKSKDSSGANRDVVYMTAANHIVFGTGAHDVGGDTYIGGKNLNLRYGTTPTIGMVLNSSGNVLIGTTSDNGAKLQVATSEDYPIRTTLSSHTSTYRHAFGGYSPNMASGCYVTMEVGKTTSAYNTAYIGYGHTADGSTANYLTLGLYAVDNILRIHGDRTIRFNHEGSNYAEGLRLTNVAGSSYTWSEINFGCAVGADYGTHAYQWTVGRNGNNNYFVIRNNQYDRLTIDLSGNASFSGNLTVSGGGAFGSDARYKRILHNTDISLATIANAPLFDYKWTGREDEKVYLGTTAQYWMDTAFANAVNTSNPDFFHLDYGALGVGIGITVAREVKGVKTEVKGVKTEVEQLREEVKELKEKINKYEQIWHN